jgi:RNA polymerase sigma-70 factor (ECF subfamily)
VRAAVEATPLVAPAVPSFAEVYRDYATYSWRVLRRLGVREADVADVCQELFLVVHKKLPGFAHRSSLRTWLYSIAIRCASDYRRRAHVKREQPTNALDDRAPIDAPQPASLAQREARALLDQILDTLDGPKRAVFVLYELEEMTMADIATCLDLPPGTVASRLRRAREDWSERVARHRARTERGGRS